MRWEEVVKNYMRYQMAILSFDCCFNDIFDYGF